MCVEGRRRLERKPSKQNIHLPIESCERPSDNDARRLGQCTPEGVERPRPLRLSGHLASVGEKLEPVLSMKDGKNGDKNSRWFAGNEGIRNRTLLGENLWTTVGIHSLIPHEAPARERQGAQNSKETGRQPL